MNGVAAAKAVGVYLALAVVPGAWITAFAWAATSGQPEFVVQTIALAPIYLAIVVCAFFLLIWVPLASMYDHFNRKGGK